MIFLQKLYSHFFGKYVGQDAFGNRYYTEKNPSAAYRTKRWVVYCGEPEASKVPPDWHGWLHHTALAAPPATGLATRKSWIKPYQSNATGTANAYLPRGHVLRGGKRAAASADYSAWIPPAE